MSPKRVVSHIVLSNMGFLRVAHEWTMEDFAPNPLC